MIKNFGTSSVSDVNRTIKWLEDRSSVPGRVSSLSLLFLAGSGLSLFCSWQGQVSLSSVPGRVRSLSLLFLAGSGLSLLFLAGSGLSLFCSWQGQVSLSSVPGRVRSLSLRSLSPDRLWGPHSLLSNGYKGVKRPGREDDTPPPSAV
jgi:hypothetical protein